MHAQHIYLLLSQFYSVFIYAFASLFSMLNPIGLSAVFLSMTKDYSADMRHQMAYRVALYSCLLLIGTYFIGPSLLQFFGISLSCIEVAGGMLIFKTAWGMLDTKSKISKDEKQEAAHHQDIIFFPLTMPITAGAGAMAVTIALAAKLSKPHQLDVIDPISVVAAIVAVFIIVAICYRYSDSIFQKLGHTGTNVVTRLTAFILLAISVRLIWDGIQDLVFPAIAHHHTTH